MVFMKFLCHPEDEKAILGVRMTTSSPKLSLSKMKSSPSEPILEINILVRCLKSVERDKPITFATSGSIFETAKSEDGHMDKLACGMLGPGLFCKDPIDDRKVKIISLGYFRLHRARQKNDDAVNLLDRPDVAIITVPPETSEEEATFTHLISTDRLFAFTEKIGPSDLKVGEVYEMSINDNYLGAMWWCWGNLEKDLKGKKLHSFSKGINVIGSGERPSNEETAKQGMGNWRGHQAVGLQARRWRSYMRSRSC